MELFKMAKEAMSMRSKMKEIDKTLKSKIIDVEYKGILVTVNAKSEILGMKFSDDIAQKQVKDVEKIILGACQEAIKKSQQVMAEESRKLMGGMNIPGLN